mgnify:CR=1 FL=1
MLIFLLFDVFTVLFSVTFAPGLLVSDPSDVFVATFVLGAVFATFDVVVILFVVVTFFVVLVEILSLLVCVVGVSCCILLEFICVSVVFAADMHPIRHIIMNDRIIA